MTWDSRIVRSGEENPHQLLAHPENWRVHPQQQQDALAGVLDSVGWVQTVVVNEVTNHIVDGHLRVLLAMQREEKSIPVVYVNLTPDEERLVLATLDPLSAMAGTDKDVLADLLASISSEDAAVTALLDDLAKNAGLDTSREGLTDPDDVPEPPKKPVTKPGDLWVLGDHRLLCGDATSRSDVEHVMEGGRAELCMTDPPYGAGIDYTMHEDDQTALVRIIEGFFPLARKHSELVALTPGINNMWLYQKPDWVLCWFYAAGTGRSPWGFTAWQPFLVWGACPKLSAGEGCHPDGFQYMMSQDDAAQAKALQHVVPKPYSVWERFMERLSNKHTRTVFDPFCGSGTTMIATEKLGFACRAVEIDPAYCDVIVERWENFTGQKAKRSK